MLSLPTFALDSWTSVIEPRENSLLFVDLTRLEVKNSVVKVFVLLNKLEPQKMPNGTTYQSTVNRYEIDCRARTVRVLQIYAYSEMFAGERAVAVSTEQDKDLIVPAPNSIGESIIQFVCARVGATKPQKR